MTNPNVTPVADPDLVAPGMGQRPTNFRWIICALLFYVTTLNYIDRSIFGVLAADLQKNIGWNDVQFGYINAAFTAAYALGFIFMGRFIDIVGTRVGYAISLVIWTCAGIGTAFARTALGFGLARFFLGFGESGNFPAAIKTVAEWFPQRQRSTATGIFNAGSNVGAILAPFSVPIVVLAWGGYMYAMTPAAATTPAHAVSDAVKIHYGWPAAFFITPLLAAIWIVLWLVLYRTPEKSRFANAAEVAVINEDGPVNAPQVAVRWRHIIPHPQAWAFMVGKFLTDPIWWFYLFWSGKFFEETFHVKLSGLAGPLILIYVLADFGSIGGGWLSSILMKIGFSPNAGRKIAMLTCAICILPVCYAPLTPHMWVAATLIGIAAAAHQGFSANLFTLTSDMFPKRAVASVVGLGGLTGAIGGFIVQAGAGWVKTITGSYLIMFIIAGTVYILAFVCIHLLAPRLTPVKLHGGEGFPVDQVPSV
ncbi:MAG TPA: MFS transporter [Phycisphaerae bacterium]|nr:MFS transporter [Phycisphaerae bacterium]